MAAEAEASQRTHIRLGTPPSYESVMQRTQHHNVSYEEDPAQRDPVASYVESWCALGQEVDHRY